MTKEELEKMDALKTESIRTSVRGHNLAKSLGVDLTKEQEAQIVRTQQEAKEQWEKCKDRYVKGAELDSCIQDLEYVIDKIENMDNDYRKSTRIIFSEPKMKMLTELRSSLAELEMEFESL